MSSERRNKRQGKRMLNKLQKAKKSTQIYKENFNFFTDLQTENQMLNLIYTQKKLIKGIQGGFFERIYNYYMGFNPLIKIMHDRRKLLEKLKDVTSNESIETKSGPGTGEADTS